MGQAAAAEADSPTPEVSAAAPNHETSITRVIARALAWVSLGSAAILAPIGGFVWWRTQVRERERQARKAERRHKRRARRHAERQQRRAREEAEPVSNEV
jgi:ABC-type nickel/cobalt efflux system permease component RcnA